MRANIGQIAGKKLSGAVAGAKSLTGGVPKFGLGAAFQKLSHIAKQAATEIYNGVQGITVGNDTAGLTTPTQTSGLAPTDQGQLGLNNIPGIVSAATSGDIGGVLQAVGGPNLNSNSLDIGDLTNSNGINVLSQLTGNQNSGGGVSNQNVTPTFSQPNYKGNKGQVNLFDAKDSIAGVSVQDPMRIVSGTETAREKYRSTIGSNYKV